MKFNGLARIFFTIILAISTQIALSLPERNPDKLEKPALEKALRVRTAKVLLCNYDLLRNDFQELRSLSNPEIDGWLLENAAYISLPHAIDNEVNTIPVVDSHDIVNSIRPLGYGRATVRPVKGGLLDIKGTGVAENQKPRNASHANGLMSLGEAIREFVMQNLVESVFSHAKNHDFRPQSGQPLTTVKSYAVIDWGFFIYDDFSKFRFINGGLMRAGAIVRQAHTRKMVKGSGNHFLRKNMADEVESLLRVYGITTSGNISSGIDIPDIQATATHEIFDFGTYVVMDRFTKERTSPLGSDSEKVKPVSETTRTRLLSLMDAPVQSFSGTLALSKPEVERSEDDQYVYPDIQPELKISVPFELWGFNRFFNPAGKCNLDNIRILGETIAASITASEITFVPSEVHISDLDEVTLKGSFPAIEYTDQSVSSVNSGALVLSEKNQVVSFQGNDGSASRNRGPEVSFQQVPQLTFEEARERLENQIQYIFNAVFFKWYPEVFGQLAPYLGK